MATENVTYGAKKVTLWMWLGCFLISIIIITIKTIPIIITETNSVPNEGEYELTPDVVLIINLTIFSIFGLFLLWKAMINNHRYKITFTEKCAIFYNIWGKKRGEIYWKDIIRVTDTGFTLWLVTEKEYQSINYGSFLEVHDFLEDLHSRLPEGVDISEWIIIFLQRPRSETQDMFQDTFWNTFWK